MWTSQQTYWTFIYLENFSLSFSFENSAYKILSLENKKFVSSLHDSQLLSQNFMKFYIYHVPLGKIENSVIVGILSHYFNENNSRISHLI